MMKAFDYKEHFESRKKGRGLFSSFAFAVDGDKKILQRFKGNNE